MTDSANNRVMISMTFLFFLWGFMTVLNDILIPFLRSHYELDFFESMLVQTSFFGSYFTGSLIYFLLSKTSGDPINRIGYKDGIIYGLLISALGCLIFYPAGLADSYYMFLLGLMVLGFGFTLLQIAANPFVLISGGPENASSRLNLAQGFNSLGTTMGPLIGGLVIFNLFSGIDAVAYPYFFVGLIFLSVALIFRFLNIPSWKNEESFKQGFSALSFPNLKWGIIGIFCYVGAEVGIGSIVVNLLGLEEFGGMKEELASDYLSLYWGGLMIGRFGGSVFMKGELGAKKILKASLYMALALVVILIANLVKGGIPVEKFLLFVFMTLLSFGFFLLGQGQERKTLSIFSLAIILLLLFSIFIGSDLALWAIISIGLFNSIMWPNLFSLSIKGLGKYTSQGSSLLVMAILGGALVPLMMGLLADQFSLITSLLLPVICYLYIFSYASFLSRD